MRPRSTKSVVRVTAGGVVVLCLLALLASFVAASGPAAGGATGGVDDADVGAGQRPTGLTVVSTQGFYVGNHPGDRDVAELIAFAPDGTVVYRDTRHQVYYDVDPVPGTRATVEFVAADRVGRDRCNGAARCSRNLVERVNLSTGEITTVFAAITPKFDGGRWHDVDRVNETHLLIADLVYDRVVLVDTRTSSVVWQWNATEHFPRSMGGGQNDWTHINDVERLEDGRIMASIRNMDAVVFIDPARGVDPAWTLGSDDDHDTLFEPHNPDYLPEARGGPAVVIADSENNRVVEYHRRAGDWRPAWSWRDARLQWPRDADRLPSGGTLIADSHGDRVIQVGPDGSIVWSVAIGRPYDVERLGTGDESGTGYAAGSSPNCRDGCGAPPAEAQGETRLGGILVTVKDRFAPTLVNSLLFIGPPWLQFTDLIVGGVLVSTMLVWALLEWVWSDRTVAAALSRLRSLGR